MPVTNEAKWVINKLFSEPQPEYTLKPIFSWYSKEDLHSHNIIKDGRIWGRVVWCGQIGVGFRTTYSNNGYPLDQMKKLITLLEQAQEEINNWIKERRCQG